MLNFLASVVLLMSIIVVFGFFNEKVTKLTNEIALMLFSVILVCALTLFCLAFFGKDQVYELLSSIQIFDINKFLMEGVLCYMIFAGSCHMKLRKFKEEARIISLLAIGATFLGAIFYGVLFYGASILMGLDLTLPICLMFGSITAPTDPIAATSILKKFNLPENIGFAIEGESLLNDGVGVALFVCFSSMVTAHSSGNILSVIVIQLAGALLVGLIVTAICFPVFRATGDSARGIFVSILAVTTSYTICQHMDFSGAVASVVCGVLFSALRNHEEECGREMDLKEYDIFWSLLDTLLNSILCVLLGLTFVHIIQMQHVIIISVTAVIINLLSRYGSVSFVSIFAGKLPDNYSKTNFAKLLTWGGLRGGVSIALAMSTQGFLPDEIYHIILGGTYALVLFTTVVQGLTIPKVYEIIKKSTE